MSAIWADDSYRGDGLLVGTGRKGSETPARKTGGVFLCPKSPKDSSELPRNEDEYEPMAPFRQRLISALRPAWRNSAALILRRVQLAIVLLSFWMLAIALPGVHFAPGNWTAIQESLRSDQHSSELLTGVFAALVLIALAGFLVLALRRIFARKKKSDPEHQLYREPIPTPWSIYLVVVFMLAAAAGLAWWAWEPADLTERTATSVYSQPSAGDREKESPPAAPPDALPGREHQSREWLVIPLASFFSIGLGVVLRRWLRRQPEKETPEIPKVGQVVARSVWELEKGGELSDVVLQCYRQMCHVLAQKAVLRREMTVREFVEQLNQVGVRSKEIAGLTELFERVRYGRLKTGPEERTEAIALLKAVETRYGKGPDGT